MASLAALCSLALLCAAAAAATPAADRGGHDGAHEWAADLVRQARQLGFEESIDAHVARSKAVGKLDPMSGFYEVERMLTETMNDSVAPCDDFEQYACGMYKVIHNKTLYEMDAMTMMQVRIYTEMADWLEKQHVSNAKPPGHAIEQAILDYYYCRHGRGTDIDKDIRDIRASLWEYGGWPMIDGDQWRPYYAGPMGLVGSIGGRYNPETLITMGAISDWVHPGMNALYIDAVNIQDATTGRPLHPDVHQLAAAAFELALGFAEAVNVTVDKKQLRKDADAVALLQAEAMNTTWRINGWKLPSQKPGRIPLRYHNLFDVVSALNRWPRINWPYFLIKFAEGNIDLYHAFAHPFIVIQPEYFDWLNAVLETYDERTLTNFVMWKYVLALAERHPSLRHHHAATQSALGYSKPMPSPIYCASVVTRDMNYAAGRIYVDMSDLTKQDMDELNTMIGLVLAAWRGMIQSVGWMSDGSKEQAFAKIANVARNVAYPSWLMSDNDLNAYYDKLDVRKSDDNFEAILKFLRFGAWAQFRNVGAKVDRNAQSWDHYSSAIVNAWYNPMMNSITFTAAVMSAPAFKATYPRAYNFASIGSVMGHELGHGFDNNGVYWNYEGAFVNGTWMDPASRRGFDHMAQCVAVQYDQFCLELHGPGTDCVDGNKTLGENLADNGGVVAAYRAYVAFNALMGGEPLLPANGSLGGLSHAQIFFQSYGHYWCSDVPDDLALQRLATDTHSPDRFRVIGVVQNSAEFAAAWQCKRGDPMAPDDPCVVWHDPKHTGA